MIKAIMRWFKLIFTDCYDCRYTAKDGTRYVIMPTGQRRRVHSKRELKQYQKEKAVLDWARRAIGGG